MVSSGVFFLISIIGVGVKWVPLLYIVSYLSTVMSDLMTDGLQLRKLFSARGAFGCTE